MADSRQAESDLRTAVKPVILPKVRFAVRFTMTYRPMLFRFFGFFSLAVAIGGAFIPFMPTVPFLVLAAFLFSKSSPEWHQWIRNHPRFGETVRDWEEKGVVRWPIKILTGLCLLSMMTIPFFLEGSPLIIKVSWIAILAPIAVYLFSRPSTR